MTKIKVVGLICMAALALGPVLYNAGFAHGAQSQRRAIKATGPFANLPFSMGVVAGTHSTWPG